MVWYNPLSWFGSKEEQPVYCDNPDCRGVILDEAVLQSKSGRIYHNTSDCKLGMLHHSPLDVAIKLSPISYALPIKLVNLREARRLLKEGKLEQSLSRE